MLQFYPEPREARSGSARQENQVAFATVGCTPRDEEFFMRNKKKIVLVVGIVLLFAYGIFEWYAVRQQSLLTGKNYYPQTNIIYEQKETIVYQGRDNVDALTLLKQKTSIKQDASGLVTTINGREANEKAKEYWAFYINGKPATVGPAEYITKKGERIEWRLETF